MNKRGKGRSKKIFIGSIMMVVILIMMTFTSVVGFQNVKSDIAITSPLFGVRTNKVLNIKQDAVKSSFIGKGRVINFLLPKRNNKLVLSNTFVEYIKMMDDEAFNRFVKFTIGQLYKSNDFKEYSGEYIVNAFTQLRNDKIEIKNNINSELKDNSHITRRDECTTVFCATTGGFILCFLEFIVVLTGWFIFIISSFIGAGIL